MGDRSSNALRREIENNLTYVKKIARSAQEYLQSIDDIPHELEWLLDNRFIAEREGRDVIRSLKYMHGRNIIKLFKSTRSFLNECSFQVEPSDFERYLAGEKMSERELWGFETILKCALVNSFAEVCKKIEVFLNEVDKKPEENDFAAERLVIQARASGVPPCPQYLERALRAREYHEQCEGELSKIIKLLSQVSSIQLRSIIEAVSPVEKILREDSDYPNMSEESRAYYRHCIMREAKKHKKSEREIAQKAQQKAKENGRHVGFYLIPKKKYSQIAYMTVIAAATMTFSLIIASFYGFWWLFILLFPVWSIVKNVMDFLIIRMVPPSHIPRMALKDGIPEEGKTLCVISTLLTDPEKARGFSETLERYHLANRNAGEYMNYGILADFKDAKVLKRPQDEEILDAAKEAVDLLNQKYGSGFFLFYRSRVYNKRDDIYMGWERKRGALHSLISFLKGENSGIGVFGDRARLSDTRYLITLDGDTRLNIESAVRMVGAMLHPLNRAKVDETRRIVTDGYGILQPRIGVDLRAANKSRFSRLFAGLGGVDPYGSAASDVYQDVFGEGIFTGKGILDVSATYICLNHRFPEGQILSHDLLEGSYLRAGYLSDVELTDGFPYKVIAYFDRQHRWIRGDWQIMPWLGSVSKTQNGVEKNPISRGAKWKIFENLRRSVTPVFVLLALVFGNFGVALTAWIALAANLLLSFAAELGRGGGEFSTRYNSTVICGVSGAFLQTMVQIIMLPHEAYLSLNAVICALYRMFISKKNLLAWVTAAEAEAAQRSGLSASYRRMWFCPVLGVLCTLFLNPLGILWIFAPCLAQWMSKPVDGQYTISEQDREFLLFNAQAMWQYFEDFVNEEENFLPPDNWQELPANGLASRTSPTNIGLALLCAISAHDLGFITCDHALDMIENMINATQNLKKWKGNLLNWYDTKTAKPLAPRWVSTVDSGNLATCLIALREAISEFESERGDRIIQKVNTLIDEMDFEFLYDSNRKLFYIGYDVDNEKPTNSWYDLMESEARQTSYYAIARGIVPKKHWSHLGRALVKSGKYAGMASWTGTMFEYFMPNLLMPCIENGAIYESNQFALYCQKERTKSLDVPWGVSESAFYAFDADMNYQYKAHGIQKLGLKRGLDLELVISPYSTFITLPVAGEEAIVNLRRLHAMGLTGRYGLFEAADFTRVKQGDFSPVKTFMVHHLGMSLLAINNTIHENIMVKRFMRDAEMAAHEELLEEKVPINPVVMDVRVHHVPQRPGARDGQPWSTAQTGFNIWQPRCTILSGGKYRAFLTETGLSRSSVGSLELLRFDKKQIDGAQGIAFFVNTDKVFSLTPAPYFDDSVEYCSELDGDSVRIRAKCGMLETKVETWVPDMENAELREVTLKNEDTTAVDLELVVYAEPTLSMPGDYYSHPTFSKLFLQTEIVDRQVIVCRRPRTGNQYHYLTFLCDAENVQYDTSKEKALGRGGIYALPVALSQPPGNTQGAVIDPCIMARVKVSLQPGESRVIRFALGYGTSREQSQKTVERVFSLPRRKNVTLDDLAQKLGLHPAQVNEAMSTLCELTFLTDARRARAEFIEKNKLGQDGLWKFGISGDLPIVSTRFDDVETIQNLQKLIGEYCLLCGLGVSHDLVILLSDGGDYMRPRRSAVIEILKHLHLEGKLNQTGGIHLVDILPGSDEERLIFALSAVCYSCENGQGALESQNVPMIRMVARYHIRESCDPDISYQADGTVVINAGKALPPVAWSNMLANENMGYVATDAGTGHMWAKNARENKITPWLNDPFNVMGGEKLSVGGISLFAAPDGAPCKVLYGLGFAEWEKTVFDANVTVTAFVAKNRNIRVFLISSTAPIAVEYFSELTMGNGDNISQIQTFFDEKTGAICAKNAYNCDFAPQVYGVLTRGGGLRYTCNAPSWYAERYDAKTGAGYIPCIGLELTLSERGGMYRGAILSAWGEDEHDFVNLVDVDLDAEFSQTKAYWNELCRPIVVKTPFDALDRYINGWALYQACACRIFGRTSLYQSGGAFGFRDQLQDACAFAAYHPEILKEQILRAAAHQYEEGDVQHWWHETSFADRGVRTRITDDLLWLPYSVYEYVNKTGDRTILDIKVHYIASEELRENEHERYETPQVSAMSGTIAEHCTRAIDLVLARGAGDRGLVKIGGGDWNDGMNKVGALGRGESTWLTWFLELVLRRYYEIDPNPDYLKAADEYGHAASEAWDGNWFIRGTYDNGMLLGSNESEECKIDSIAQSFATFSKVCPEEKKNQAIDAAIAYLVDVDHRVVRLFAPAFDQTKLNPGYIKGYLAGIRENGGQYTHGAIWLAMASFLLGRGDDGYQLLSLILPETHDPCTYRAEPYVLAGDVYYNPAHMGRGGWSWYTGSAAWFWRVATENMLGLRVQDGKLMIEPNLPKDWKGFSAEITLSGKKIQVEYPRNKDI